MLKNLQDDIGCFVSGECVDSDVLTEVHADSSNDCLQECKDYEFGGGDVGCDDFTYYGDSEVGWMFYFCKKKCLFQ